MKSLYTFVFILLSISAFAQSKDIEALRQFNLDLNNSTVAKDTAIQGRIFADDMLLTNPAGETYNKQQLLKRLMAGPQLLSLKIDSVSIRVMGNIGLVNCKVTGAFTIDGKTGTAQTCYLDVYEKRKGRWYEIAAHVSVLDGK
jgi:ketosteroid isomerase-like protein